MLAESRTKQTISHNVQDSKVRYYNPIHYLIIQGYKIYICETVADLENSAINSGHFLTAYVYCMP